jgi:hypothetical protein
MSCNILTDRPKQEHHFALITHRDVPGWNPAYKYDVPCLNTPNKQIDRHLTIELLTFDVKIPRQQLLSAPIMHIFVWHSHLSEATRHYKRPRPRTTKGNISNISYQFRVIILCIDVDQPEREADADTYRRLRLTTCLSAMSFWSSDVNPHRNFICLSL